MPSRYRSCVLENSGRLPGFNGLTFAIMDQTEAGEACRRARHYACVIESLESRTLLTTTVVDTEPNDRTPQILPADVSFTIKGSLGGPGEADPIGPVDNYRFEAKLGQTIAGKVSGMIVKPRFPFVVRQVSISNDNFSNGAVPLDSWGGDGTFSIPVTSSGQFNIYLYLGADGFAVPPQDYRIDFTLEPTDIIINDAKTDAKYEHLEFDYAIAKHDSAPFAVQAYLSEDEVVDENDTVLGKMEISDPDKLKTNADGSEKNYKDVPFELSTKPAITKNKRFLLVEADPNNEIAEADEKNNETVSIPDFKERQHAGFRSTDRSYVYDISETNAVGAIAGRISRGTANFNLLVDGGSMSKWKSGLGGTFKDEEKSNSPPYKGDDAMMQLSLIKPLNQFVDLVNAIKRDHPERLGASTYQINEAFDEDGEHANYSTHYEGRAIDISGSGLGASNVGKYAGIALLAGFEWVNYEYSVGSDGVPVRHLHLSMSGSRAEASLEVLRDAINWGAARDNMVSGDVHDKLIEIVDEIDRYLQDGNSRRSAIAQDLRGRFIGLVKEASSRGRLKFGFRLLPDPRRHVDTEGYLNFTINQILLGRHRYRPGSA